MTIITPRKFLFHTATVILLLITIYLIAFKLSISSYTKSEWWIKNVYQYKEYVASNIDKPKIIIAGGSNALFGINGGVIEELTGFPVVNLATHAGLDIDFLYYKISDNLNEGDVVVLPLEFGAYKGTIDKAWFYNNMLSWGYEDYIERLTLSDKLLFIARTPKSRIYRGLSGIDRQRPLLNQEKVVDIVTNQLSSSEAGKWNGFSIKSLNKYGDINVDEEPKKILIASHNNGIRYIGFTINEHFITVFRKLERLIDARGGQLILTWPVTIKNKLFDLSTDVSQWRAEHFRKLLRDRSIDIRCNPALFNLDLRFFFNTLYHPNTKGALIRSRNLAFCLNTILNQEDNQEMKYSDATMMVDKLQTEFDSHKENTTSLKP